MSVAPKSFNLPQRSTLNETDVAQLGAAVMALTRELWVLTDRFHVLEAVLERRGIDVTAEIEAFQPSPEMQARLNARGKTMVAHVVNALADIVPR
jgi:hypothetical protein